MGRKRALFRNVKLNGVALDFFNQHSYTTKKPIELSKRGYYSLKFEMHEHDTTATWKIINYICVNSLRKYKFNQIVTSNGTNSYSKVMAC